MPVTAEEEVPGSIWYQATKPPLFPDLRGFSVLAFDDRIWVLGGSVDEGFQEVPTFSNEVYYSSDGESWTRVNSDSLYTPRDDSTTVVFDNKMWVIGGINESGSINDVWYSSDGVMWVQATSSAGFPERDEYSIHVYDDKMWVIGGFDYSRSMPFLNDVWYSADGVNWTEATPSAAFPARAYHSSFFYDDKMWVTGGCFFNYDVDPFIDICYDDIWYSTDGVTWSQAMSSAPYPAQAGYITLVFNDKLWMIGGSTVDYERLNNIWCSTDGVDWTEVSPQAGSGIPGEVIDFGGYPVVSTDGNKIYMLYENLGDVWSSPDMVTWTKIGSPRTISPSRGGHTSVVFDDKYWVIGGRTTSSMNDVWYSNDGEYWSLAPQAAFPCRDGHTTVVFDNKIWVIGGGNGARYLNDVWYSSDGVTWTEATSSAEFPEREDHTSVVYDGRMWVIGGTTGYPDYSVNDVWYSSDGVTWTEATSSAAFPGRYDHTSVVYDDRMWVIGGTTGYFDDDSLNDIWYSSDGVTWTQATGSAAFSARSGHTSIVYKGPMWVIGGSGPGDGELNDVWYSMDGITWIESNASAAFPYRQQGYSLVKSSDGERMWLIGGEEDSSLMTDIWYSEVRDYPTIAGFIANPNNGTAPLEVQFTDHTIEGTAPITSYYWDFGDGTNSTEQNPVHTFTKLGGNHVTMTVTDSILREFSWNATITVLPEPVIPPAPEAYFLMWDSNGASPLTVKFMDSSSGDITGWLYIFGDGSVSGERNPVHTYTATTSGLHFYTPELRVTDSLGRTSTYKTPISVSFWGPDPDAPVADFISTVISTPPNQPGVKITDRSQKATNLRYYLGDGTMTTNPDPTHYYEKTGFYRITQQVWNTFGNRKKSVDMDFRTTPPDAKPSNIVSASYAADYYLGDSPLTVQFYDRSWGDVKSYYWEFSDGTVSSEQNPSHTFTYEENGLHVYVPRLTVTDVDGAISQFSSPISVWGEPYESSTPTQTPTPTATTVIPTTGTTTPTGTWTATLTATPTATPSGPELIATRVYSIPENPEFIEDYSIVVDVQNPADYPASRWMRITETTISPGINDRRWPEKPYEEFNKNIGSQLSASYVFTNAHYAEPFKPLADRSQNEILTSVMANVAQYSASTGINLIGIVGDDLGKVALEEGVGKIGSLFGWCLIVDNLQSVLEKGFGCTPFAEYAYSFEANNIILGPYMTVYAGDQLNTLVYHAKIRAAWWKYGAFIEGLLNESTGTIYSILVMYLVETGAVTTPQGAGLDIALSGFAFGHAVLAEINYQQAVDPVPDYTDPVVIEPFVIPDIDQYPDESLKDYARQLETTISHSNALKDATIKYSGAQAASDKLWTAILQKERYRYTSYVENDISALRKKAIPMLEYLNRSGVNPTAADVAAAKQIISQQGISQQLVGYLQNLGYSDEDVDSKKIIASLVPDVQVVNYDATILSELAKYEYTNGLVLSNVTSDLGPNAPPYAKFNVSTTYGKAPLTVEFNDESLRNATLFSWDFGDNQTIMTQNPTVFYTYMNPGSYTVTLTASSPTGSDTRVKYKLITVEESNMPIVDFNATPTSGKAPLAVQFNDTSSNDPTSWLWDFGDGFNSTEQNPAHLYAEGGNYSVTLTATNADGSDIITMIDLINVIPLFKPVPDFTANVTAGKAPLAVQFNDTSSNDPTSWLWDFGDGFNSTEQNPVHLYTEGGNYSVMLTATNADGSNSITMTGLINVIPLFRPVPDFTANVTSGKAPLAVQFTDASSNGPTGWLWDFGDGFNSTEQNPAHIYSVSGMYDVTLEAVNGDGSSILTKPGYIAVLSDDPLDLIDQLITYIDNQRNIPVFFRVIWTNELRYVKYRLNHGDNSDAVIIMESFKSQVAVFNGWFIRPDQSAEILNSADAIIRAIDLPVNQEAIDGTNLLKAEVSALGLPRSTERILTGNLDLALFYIERANNRDARYQLNSFIRSVRQQEGRRIPHDKVDQLIAGAQNIIGILQ